jgi:transcriptional regulator with XRE-family HTH domain
MTLLRRVLGDTLRGRRLRQRRTLREVSGAARVSLGYLSEVERGQKEASSELLASICAALDVKLSDLLSEVSETMRRSERAAEVARMPRVTIPAPVRRPVPVGAGAPVPRYEEPVEETVYDEPLAEEDVLDEVVEEAAPTEPSPATDALADPAGGDGLELDDVGLADLETGDGLGELEVLAGLTELAGGSGGFAARCLVAA